MAIIMWHLSSSSFSQHLVCNTMSSFQTGSRVWAFTLVRGAFFDAEITIGLFKERRQRDIKLGYTGFGFHRVDISFVKNNKKVIGLSRGEEKTLTIIFLLSLLSVVKVHHKGILLLLDDLGAEAPRDRLPEVGQFCAVEVSIFEVFGHPNGQSLKQNSKFIVFFREGWMSR